MSNPPQFYKVIITAPDGRFGTKVIEGGLEKKAAEFKAKKYKELGIVVKIIPEKRIILKQKAQGK